MPCAYYHEESMQRLVEVMAGCCVEIDEDTYEKKAICIFIPDMEK